jgi:hypothetical protein
MRRLFWLGILLLLCTGCKQWGLELFGKGESESKRWAGLPKDELWGVLQEAVNDYYDIRLADDEALYLLSEWKEFRAPMYKSGKRFRVKAWVKWDEEHKASYLEVQVEREINENMDRPLSKAEADWVTDWDNDGRDVSREKQLIWLVNFRLKKEIKPSAEVLARAPSIYRQDPDKRRREELWRKEGGKGKGREKPPRKDLWDD